MSVSNKCPQCGASVDANAVTCKYCGESITQQSPPQAAAPQVAAPQHQQAAPVIHIHQQVSQQATPQAPQQVFHQVSDINPHWPIKSKVAAGILAIFLGGLGIHKFYLGKGGMGILYLLFCWTFLPAAVGLIEGIIYLTQSDYAFQVKNQVRVV